MAAGIGQAANTAAVTSDIQFLYDGTVFRDVTLWPHDLDIAMTYPGMMVLEGNPYGIIGRFGLLQLGNVFLFPGIGNLIENPDNWVGSYNKRGGQLIALI